ncbi:hypothetical protein [Wenyingzhuangia sp. IMCC45574]
MRFLVFLFIFSLQLGYSQKINIHKKLTFPNTLKENSGIALLNNDIVTFNDSGGKPELYIVSTSSGVIKRTVSITNATNEDWESITSDDRFIYIGDTGNNKGNRNDLVIYKVLINDVKTKEFVKAQKIHFHYEDQKDFSEQKHTTNFDCEAITVYKDKILLFTKNWGNFKTNVYSILKEEGDYNALKENSIPINCMLTSIDYNPTNKTFMGTGYDRDYRTYLIQIKESDFTHHTFKRIDLFKEIGIANQVEAIVWKNSKEFYVSRERSNEKVEGKRYKRKPKLFLLSLSK